MEIDLRAKLLQAVLALRVGSAEQAAEIAGLTADKALAMGNIPLEVAACRLWQSANLAGSSTMPSPGTQRLANLLEAISQRTKTPEIRSRLTELQASVDKTY